ncbi:MAG: sugar phosphate nucleotidyltransferase, partial [Bacteroidales bacterium]|nr:sugar phosphate nucleotidyltransferase [Bacteroidales bacterium]
MKAMILAAGLGTRLKPETNHKPKGLINVFGKPMISLLIDRLTGYGYTTIVVNVHHHADMLIHYLNKRHADINLLISDERTQLLDTGGALKKAKDMLSGDAPVLVHNVDVLTDIDLHDLNKK